MTEPNVAELVQPKMAPKMDQPWESEVSSGLQQSRCQTEPLCGADALAEARRGEVGRSEVEVSQSGVSTSGAFGRGGRGGIAALMR